MQIISAVKAPLSAGLRHAYVRNRKWKKKNADQVVELVRFSEGEGSWKVIICAEKQLAGEQERCVLIMEMDCKHQACITSFKYFV